MWRRMVKRVAVSLLAILVLTNPVAGAEDDPPQLGYGMMLAYPPNHLGLVKNAGFDWFKYFAYWHAVDPEQDRTYNWETVDWRLNEACEHELNILLRVERDSTDWTPIRDGEMAAWEAFFTDLVAHIVAHQGACPTPYRAALEIWNEPNLDFQWGYQDVDPVRYTEMVKRAYRGAKAAPGGAEIPIVAGSLAPTGGMGGGHAMNDVDFLEAMYAAGLRGHFDAISIHNYGFGGPPEEKTWGNGITNFRRAEDIHAVMVAHGDGALPVWATEFGWLLASEACDGYWHEIGFAWQQVSAETQADYLRRAFAYAQANWPWMGTMIVSNLDFSVLPWYGPCDPLRYFAILNADGTPRPAYTALAQMPKAPAVTWGMAISPASLSWLHAGDATAVVSQTVTVQKTGNQTFTWGLSVDAGTLPVTVAPTTGSADGAFVVTADPRGLGLGTYTAAITVTADAPEVPESPITLPVRVHIVEVIYEAYLPLITKER